MSLNIYKFIHKTIRGQLSQLVIQSGMTSYHDPVQVADLHLSIVKLERFLENHAIREDRFVHPVLKEKAFPDLSALEATHHVIDTEIHAIVAQIAAIKASVDAGSFSAEDLEEKGYAFYLAFSDFTAAYLVHMSDEERKGMPFLWENFTPNEIFSVFLAMQSTLTSEEIIETIPVMYPYLNLQEAVKLTGMLKDEDHFPAMVDAIKKSLQSQNCSEILKLAGVA